MTDTLRSGLADVKITSDGLRGTVVVNGQDITDHVYDLQMKAGGREVTEVWVRLRAGVEFDGQGIVHDVREVEGDRAAIIREFLDDISGDDLIEKAADSLGLGDDPGMGAAVLRVLKELAG